MNVFKIPQNDLISTSVNNSSSLTQNLSGSNSDLNPPIPYEEPEWAKEPKSDFFFEIIRNGSIIGKSQIISSSKLVAGRLPLCDIEIEHPSASRYHAVIQFKENLPFVYDLSSSHGTFLNKRKIEPRNFIRLYVGDMLKFGASSRIYVLQGPQEDAEKREEILMQKESIKRKESARLEVSWGFKEDAYEGDEWGGIDVSGSVDRGLISNQCSYFDDPKKALTLFMERNEVESQLSFSHSTSTGPKEFVAKVEISGLKGPLVATGKGKRKGHAEKDACLEACYKLEKLGILYLEEGSLADRSKRLRQEYLEEEKDNYLDKTSFVNEHKEQEKGSVETLESLTLRYQEKLDEIQTLQEKLEAERGNINSNANEEEDDLDAYMKKINEKVKKEEIRKIEIAHSVVEKEIIELEKLIVLATPKGKLSTFYQYKSNSSADKPSLHEKIVEHSTCGTVMDQSKSIDQKKADKRELQESSNPISKIPKISVESKIKAMKGPSKEEHYRHQIEKNSDIVDYIPPDLLNNENVESLSKKAAEKYGY